MKSDQLILGHNILQKAIQQLRQGKTENAMASIVKARGILVNSIPYDSSEHNTFEVLFRAFLLSECVMLHFQGLAKREQKRENVSLQHTYLGQALGINTMLECSLVPLMYRYVKDDQNKKETEDLSEENRSIKEDLCKSLSSVVDTVQWQLEAKATENVEESIKKIVNAVNPNSGEVRALAVALSKQFEAGDFKQARKIYEFVRDEIKYIYDPFGFEEIQSPETTLRLRAGDCEDQAILLSSLLAAIGFNSALIFADADNDGVADHVYSAVLIPDAPEYSKPLPHRELEDGKDLNDWIPLDPASQDSDFGVIPIGDLQISKFAVIQKNKNLREGNNNLQESS